MLKMEQLAHFVTKSFEYNNNRVLDVINMATKSLICDNLKSSDSSDILSNSGETDMDDDADTVDIDITDMSSNDEAATAETATTIGKQHEHQYNLNQQQQPHISLSIVNNNKSDSPLSLIKKTNKDYGPKYVTKNWLISDTPKKQRIEGKQNHCMVCLFVCLLEFTVVFSVGCTFYFMIRLTTTFSSFIFLVLI